MRKDWFVRILSLTILCIFVLTGSVFATDAASCDVDFVVTEDAQNVKVEMVVKNASFTDLQVALRYNPLALEPVDENGAVACVFEDFAFLSEEAILLKTKDAVLDCSKGFFEFTLYAQETDGEAEDYEFVAGEEGILVYTFNFKKIADGAVTFGGANLTPLNSSPDYSLGILHFIVNEAAAGKTLELKFGANTYASNEEGDFDYASKNGCSFKVGAGDEAYVPSDDLVLTKDGGKTEISLKAPEGEIKPGDVISVPVIVSDATGLLGAMTQVVFDTEYLSVSDKYIEESDSYEAFSDKASVFNGIFSVALNKITPGEMELELAAKDSVKPDGSTKDGIMVTSSAGICEVNVSFINGDKVTESLIKPEPEKVSDPYPGFTSADRKKDVICLKIGENMTFTMGEKKQIDTANKKVVPYIKNDRTLVPLRFISESLGAEVIWEEGWDGCIIKKGDKEIKITFGSAEFTVNGKTVTYEAPIEVVNERTMVPVRFVSEQLGCDVYWNANNQAVVIAPLENPWEESREVEAKALGEMLISILGIL